MALWVTAGDFLICLSKDESLESKQDLDRWCSNKMQFHLNRKLHSSKIHLE
jgi:hypothetical protein